MLAVQNNQDPEAMLRVEILFKMVTHNPELTATAMVADFLAPFKLKHIENWIPLKSAALFALVLDGGAKGWIEVLHLQCYLCARRGHEPEMCSVPSHDYYETYLLNDPDQLLVVQENQSGVHSGVAADFGVLL